MLFGRSSVFGMGLSFTFEFTVARLDLLCITESSVSLPVRSFDETRVCHLYEMDFGHVICAIAVSDVTGSSVDMGDGARHVLAEDMLLDVDMVLCTSVVSDGDVDDVGMTSTAEWTCVCTSKVRFGGHLVGE